MDSYDTTDKTDSTRAYGAAGSAGGETLAAIFSDRDSAHEALTELHHAGYRNVWVGTTRRDSGAAGETTMESDGGGGFMESISRFFSGEENTGHSLHDALVAHGVSPDLVRQTESSIAPGNAVVTVHGENDAEEAVSILEQFGGRLVGGSGGYTSGYGTGTMGTGLRDTDTTDTGSGIGKKVGIAAAGLGAAGIAAAAVGAARSKSDTTEPVEEVPVAARERNDETRRLQLREERLSIDKQRVSAGEARIGKEVVSETQSVDVPVFREELYIERRPVGAGTAASSTAAIGDGEEIVIPLSREQVDVQKRTVVTEEVAVGKRRIEDTERVTDTVRREELRVDDKTTGTANLGDADLRDAKLRDTTKRDF